MDIERLVKLAQMLIEQVQPRRCKYYYSTMLRHRGTISGDSGFGAEMAMVPLWMMIHPSQCCASPHATGQHLLKKMSNWGIRVDCTVVRNVGQIEPNSGLLGQLFPLRIPSRQVVEIQVK